MKRLWIYAIVAVCALSFASCGCEHVYGEWETVTTSTCSTAGVEAHTCSECGEVEERALALLEHTYGDWTVSKEATCTEKGEETAACTECEQTQTRETDMIEHSYGEWTVSKEATCTEKGEEAATCTECGQAQARETDLIEHSYDDWAVTKEATCTLDGTKTSSCEVCGASTEEIVAALGHKWSNATCTAPRTCSVCKLSEGSAIGHSWSLATCTEAAKCLNCGTKQGNALGHQYNNGICMRCNAKDPNYVEYGSVSGTITYKYNNFVGHRGDAGARIYLISKDKDVTPNSRMALGSGYGLPDGVYTCEANGNGNYTINRVPVGEYYIVVISDNTIPNFDYVTGLGSWGVIFFDFSEEDQETALNHAKLNKMENDTIEVYANQTTDFSHDFGITYI